MSAMMDSTKPRGFESKNWRETAAPLVSESQVGSKQKIWVEKGEIEDIQPGQILQLRSYREILSARGSSMIPKDFPEGSVEYGHPVVVHSRSKTELEVFVCSSFNNGDTSVEFRPPWHAEAPVIRDQKYVQQDNAARCLKLAGPAYMTKITWVRTDKVFKMDARGLQWYNFHPDVQLDEQSVGFLKSTYLGSAALYSHQRTGSRDSAIDVSFDKSPLEATSAGRAGSWRRSAAPNMIRQSQRASDPEKEKRRNGSWLKP